MRLEGVNGKVFINGEELAKIEQWSMNTGERPNRTTLQDIQNMSDAELLGMRGATACGWSLSQLELSRRGIHIRDGETALIIESKTLYNINKMLHTLKREVVQIWGRLCKPLKSKAKKVAHPKNDKKEV